MNCYHWTKPCYIPASNQCGRGSMWRVIAGNKYSILHTQSWYLGLPTVGSTGSFWPMRLGLQVAVGNEGPAYMVPGGPKRCILLEGGLGRECPRAGTRRAKACVPSTTHFPGAWPCWERLKRLNPLSASNSLSVKWVKITPTSKVELRSLLSSSSLLWYTVNM